MYVCPHTVHITYTYITATFTVTRVLKATALLLRVQATWGEEPCQFVLKELPVSREQEERCGVKELGAKLVFLQV